MEIWTEVRRRVLTGELSKRAACQEYGLNWRTLEKMLSHVEPPGYRRQAKREQPVLGPHLAWIHEVLEQDKKEPRKQRHTAKRIFDRLKAGERTPEPCVLRSSLGYQPPINASSRAVVELV